MNAWQHLLNMSSLSAGTAWDLFTHPKTTTGEVVVRGGGWLPEMSARKRTEPDTTLKDILWAIEQQRPTDAQARKSRQVVHRLVKAGDEAPYEAIVAGIDAVAVESSIKNIVRRAVQQARASVALNRVRKKRNEELMMLV